MGLRKLIVAVLFLGSVSAARGADDAREVPEAFAPFEYLIGSWKGNGVPSANRVRGWNESHAWAWRFENPNRLEVPEPYPGRLRVYEIPDLLPQEVCA